MSLRKDGSYKSDNLITLIFKSDGSPSIEYLCCVRHYVKHLFLLFSALKQPYEVYLVSSSSLFYRVRINTKCLP